MWICSYMSLCVVLCTFDCRNAAVKISAELDVHHPRQDGTCRVRIVVFLGKRVRIPLDIHVRPADWTSKKRLKEAHEKSVLYNRVIGDYLNRGERIALENPGITAENLAARLSGVSLDGKTFAEVAHFDLEETPPRSWHTQRQRSQRIGQFDRAFPDILAKDVNAAVFAKYKGILQATGMSSNSVATQLRSLRTIYNRVCKRLGTEPENVLAGLDAVERYGHAREHLTAAEVELLASYALGEVGWKAKAVHMWLFSLYAGGMRWTDLCRLTPKNIDGGRVVYVASKTRKGKNVPLFPEAAAIAKLYRGEKTLFGTPTEGKDIAAVNVVANKYLKVAARKCAIKKRLHTHNARHTSAAWMFDKGIDDRIIMDILGVDAKAFAHYKASIRPELVDEAMRKVFGKGG